MPETLPAPLLQATERLQQIVSELEEHSEPALWSLIQELLLCVDVIHRSGLRRLAGRVGSLAGSPEVRLLLELYDLLPGAQEELAREILQKVQPYIRSHGGNLEVLACQDGVVKVRLSGACHSCPGSASTLRNLVEKTLREEMPDFVALEVGEQETPGASSRLVWKRVLARQDLVTDVPYPIGIDGQRLLVVESSEDIYIYENYCPDSDLTLDGARVKDGFLVCPWHGCRFALAGGTRLGLGPGLKLLPSASEDDWVKVGLLSR